MDKLQIMRAEDNGKDKDQRVLHRQRAVLLTLTATVERRKKYFEDRAKAAATKVSTKEEKKLERDEKKKKKEDEYFQRQDKARDKRHDRWEAQQAKEACKRKRSPATRYTLVMRTGSKVTLKKM